MKMNFSQLRYLIASDHFRYHGRFSLRRLLQDLYFNRGFKITFCYRIAHYLHVNRFRVAFRLFNLYYFNLQTRLCCELPYEVQIGPGFYFGHVFGTVINPQSRFGKNVNLSQGSAKPQTLRQVAYWLQLNV